MRDFHQLKVWARAHQLTLDVYRATRAFPKDEVYVLDIAMGSASELEYHVLLSADLELLPRVTYTNLNAAVVAVKRMLAGLLRS
jgi:hypothetical protein